MSRVPAGLWQKYIAVQIYGANTDVGKTVFSTLLGLRLKHGLKRFKTKYQVQYIKPVSTGPGSDRDDESVPSILGSICTLLTRVSYVRRYTGQPVTTLYQFKEPVSPHIAARGSKDIVSKWSPTFEPIN